MANSGKNSIYITEFDHYRLERLVEVWKKRYEMDSENLELLEDELSRAEIVRPEEVPADVVTMNSKVTLADLDSGELTEVAVVFPGMASAAAGRISVLAPVGTALLGCHAGETVELPAPGRRRRFRIERVAFQPEAAGRYDL